MSETPSQPKTTPGRRRQGRNNGRHKAYASENDVVNIERCDQVPRTPQKPGAGSPAPSTSQAASKQRSRNKPKSKNAPSSPEPGRIGRHTPPHQPSSARSAAATATAFAGATFHASPAPSALPLPSFFSKPSTQSPSHRACDEARQEHSPPSGSDVAATPSHAASMPRMQESPLDFMFRAHREEKERQHHQTPLSQAPTLPTHSTSSPLHTSSPPKPATLPQTARSSARLQTNGFGCAELDGTPGQPLGPAFSTPYQERIKAARRTPSRPTSNQPLHSPISEDPTEALKKFLFNGPVPSGPSPVPNMSNNPHPFQAHHGSPYNNSSATPNACGVHDGRSNNVQAMEDNLRRILKLDLASGPPNTERRLFS